MSRFLLLMVDRAAGEPLAGLNTATGATGPLADAGVLDPAAVALCAQTGLTPGQLGVCDEIRAERYEQVAAPLDAGEKAVDRRAAGFVEVRHYSTFEAQQLAEIANAEWSAVVVGAIEGPARVGVDLNTLLRDKGIMVCRADGSVVWEETLAYGVGHGQVWVNLRGREPQGAVTPGTEYEEVRAALSRGLAKLSDERGAAVVASVRRREDLYRGAQAHRLPDLIVTLAATACFAGAGLGPVQPGPNAVVAATGTRSGPGCYFVRGPGIQAGATAVISPAAVTPLVLTLLGIPLPAECEQRAPAAVFTDEWQRKAEAAAAALSADDEAVLQQRLRNLGYIE